MRILTLSTHDLVNLRTAELVDTGTGIIVAGPNGPHDIAVPPCTIYVRLTIEELRALEHGHYVMGRLVTINPPKNPNGPTTKVVAYERDKGTGPGGVRVTTETSLHEKVALVTLASGVINLNNALNDG